MALPEMGSLQEDFGPGRQIIQHPNERHDFQLGAALQDDGAFGSNHSIPCPSGPTETTPLAAVKDGRRAYEAQRRSRSKRPMFGLALSTTHLVNDEVQCFANAVYLTVMRTHLMCSAFTMGSWGLVTTTFLTTLMDGKRSPLCLRSHPMLQSGFAQWQQLRGERANVQQDYSEFLQYFLGWVSSTHVAQTISRRFSRADEVVTEAKRCVIQSCCTMTYSLTFAPPRIANISWTSGGAPME